jgi:hypothetical protein
LAIPIALLARLADVCLNRWCASDRSTPTRRRWTTSFAVLGPLTLTLSPRGRGRQICLSAHILARIERYWGYAGMSVAESLESTRTPPGHFSGIRRARSSTSPFPAQFGSLDSTASRGSHAGLRRREGRGGRSSFRAENRDFGEAEISEKALPDCHLLPRTAVSVFSCLLQSCCRGH